MAIYVKDEGGNIGTMINGMVNVHGVARTISEIYQNIKGVTKLVWQNWKYHEGNLVKMTGNSSPSPFTATSKGWSSGSSWHAFDGTTGNNMATNNPNETGNITSTLMFGQEIRVAEITAWIGYGGPVLDNYNEPEEGVSGGWGAGNKNWLKLYGIKADGSQVLLATHQNTGSWSDASGSKRVHTVSDANQEIPFIGLTCHRGGKGGQGWYRLYDIQVTKWWQKSAVKEDNPDVSVVTISDDGEGNVMVSGVSVTDDGEGNVTVKGI